MTQAPGHLSMTLLPARPARSIACRERCLGRFIDDVSARHSLGASFLPRSRVACPGGWPASRWTGFHHFLEAPQVLFDLSIGIVTEHVGNPGADLSRGRLLVELDPHNPAAPAGRPLEMDRPGRR